VLLAVCLPISKVPNKYIHFKQLQPARGIDEGQAAGKNFQVLAQMTAPLAMKIFPKFQNIEKGLIFMLFRDLTMQPEGLFSRLRSVWHCPRIRVIL
jgi:hypothetical protein